MFFSLARNLSRPSLAQNVPFGKIAIRNLLTSATTSCPVPEISQNIKVTLIPGDGVGPELIYAVQDVVKNTGIPLDFEEIFLSEVHFSRSAGIDEAAKSIRRNNGVGLKGVIQEAYTDYSGELQGLNMKLRQELDLFANIVHIKVSRLYPKIEFEQMIIDNCCMQLVARPEQFDVMVMPNLYGNIIDNLAAGLVGGAGIVTGESVGSDCVLFESGSRHSFQQALGRQIANPTAMFLSCANMLRHLHLNEYGNALTSAVENVIKKGKTKTRDVGGYASTKDFTHAVVEHFSM